MNKQKIHYEYELSVNQTQLSDTTFQILNRMEELAEAIKAYSLASFEDKSFLLISNLTQDLIDLYQDEAVCKREIERYETLIKNKKDYGYNK